MTKVDSRARSPVAIMSGTSQQCRLYPANVLSEGSRRAAESSILFSFETDFTGRVKAEPQIETR
jgi:hypothetical protein